MSYNEKDTEYLIEQYQKDPSRETVDRLAEEFERSVKSVIGKLSREGVYRREVYKSKTGELPYTKTEIVADIAELLGVETEALVGLEKAPKGVLKTVKEAVAGLERGC